MASETNALVRLLESWDRVDHAAQRVLVAQPWQMTEAAAVLDSERLLMRAALHSFALTAGAPDEH